MCPLRHCHQKLYLIQGTVLCLVFLKHGIVSSLIVPVSYILQPEHSCGTLYPQNCIMLKLFKLALQALLLVRYFACAKNGEKPFHSVTNLLVRCFAKTMCRFASTNISVRYFASQKHCVASLHKH